MKSNFEIDYFSDSKYEYLTIEISFKGQILCQLNKDKGVNNIEIEFFYDSRLLEEVIFKFPLDEFLEVLNIVKKDLISIK
ncbi:hypothetical protein BGI40_08755 [Snodgrassella communis]|uniref:hypothetical protein n=1 Tax=Snodgrassella communis TaxID=2946699 RepID=UPI00056C1A53|nr:hypothetical protein [Snodgrassella communis]PIT09046.1 hypothetical protein BGI29_05665 [Snodgrassella communis]PIT26074.1 hypothetical protein BGI39_10655 [Snodgrassella communis]PIT28573.1 hypothetical protein BGI38_04990 [Snodgrassella communis]PIT32364.1 hypothetical protein BGI40_08755 [Snodgrassella communis]